MNCANMKKLKYIVVLCLLFTKANAFSDKAVQDPNKIIEELIYEINVINHRYELLVDDKHHQLKLLDEALSVAYSSEQKIDLLVEKEKIKSELKLLMTTTAGEISKIRYLKGLQIIKNSL